MVYICVIYQILVIDPAGPCIIERDYTDEQIVDSDVMSGFLAAVFPQMKELGFDLERINKEVNSQNATSYFEAISKHNWIIAGFSREDVSLFEFVFLLNEIGTLVFDTIGPPTGYSLIPISELDKIKKEIDILIEEKRSNLKDHIRNENKLMNRMRRRLKQRK